MIILNNVYIYAQSDPPPCADTPRPDVQWNDGVGGVKLNPPQNNYADSNIHYQTRTYSESDKPVIEYRLVKFFPTRDNPSDPFPSSLDLFNSIHDYFLKRIALDYLGTVPVFNGPWSMAPPAYYFKVRIRMPKCWWHDYVDPCTLIYRACGQESCCVIEYDCLLYRELPGEPFKLSHSAGNNAGSDVEDCVFDTLRQRDCEDVCGYYFSAKNHDLLEYLIEPFPRVSPENEDTESTQIFKLNNDFKIGFDGNNFLFITFLKGFKEKAILQIYDVLGNPVFSQTVNTALVNSEIKLDISGLTNGIYFYRINISDEQNSTGSFEIYK